MAMCTYFNVSQWHTVKWSWCRYVFGLLCHKIYSYLIWMHKKKPETFFATEKKFWCKTCPTIRIPVLDKNLFSTLIVIPMKLSGSRRKIKRKKPRTDTYPNNNYREGKTVFFSERLKTMNTDENMIQWFLKNEGKIFTFLAAARPQLHRVRILCNDDNEHNKYETVWYISIFDTRHRYIYATDILLK